MNGVTLRDNENIDRALHRLHKVCESVIVEIKGRRRYEKPCLKRKRERNDTLRRALQLRQKQEQIEKRRRY